MTITVDFFSPTKSCFTITISFSSKSPLYNILLKLYGWIWNNICTMSWGFWKHHFGIPGVRPMFLKPKLHKESKNGFKTISCRRYRIVIFSNYFFRHQKSSKKWDGFTSNQFPSHLNSIKCSINIFSDIRTT